MTSKKVWQVAYSGHGFPFLPPEPKLMTRREASRAASEWVGIADTIGGDAILVHSRTGLRVSWWHLYTGNFRR